MYIIKTEYKGEILEIIRKNTAIVFNTNTEPIEKYEYFYNNGFDWVFDIQ